MFIRLQTRQKDALFKHTFRLKKFFNHNKVLGLSGAGPLKKSQSWL